MVNLNGEGGKESVDMNMIFPLNGDLAKRFQRD